MLFTRSLLRSASGAAPAVRRGAAGECGLGWRVADCGLVGQGAASHHVAFGWGAVPRYVVLGWDLVDRFRAARMMGYRTPNT